MRHSAAATPKAAESSREQSNCRVDVSKDGSRQSQAATALLSGYRCKLTADVPLRQEFAPSGTLHEKKLVKAKR